MNSLLASREPHRRSQFRHKQGLKRPAGHDSAMALGGVGEGCRSNCGHCVCVGGDGDAWGMKGKGEVEGESRSHLFQFTVYLSVPLWQCLPQSNFHRLSFHSFQLLFFTSPPLLSPHRAAAVCFSFALLFPCLPLPLPLDTKPLTFMHFQDS